ncbi:hypothetical protein AF332_05920 [Sporosarcina globispora]|uniref:GP-PDE domain-containing protein n=1 Tax=Sporosarcina globispora TaxID=1459 RepID=A0A0M0GA49_SPOGL|nr:glycerophosphodiester phosphodiesterase family protein [Sporosarcina globispora]KON86402.1 hypothetical protein AF332_05920 [Sporosarcina globispora]
MKKQQFKLPIVTGILSAIMLGGSVLPTELVHAQNVKPLPRFIDSDFKPALTPFLLTKGYEQVWIMSEQIDQDFLHYPSTNVISETGANAGRYLYRTHQLDSHAAISVTDLTGKEETKILAQLEDWENLDELVWTPWGNLLTAESPKIANHSDAYNSKSSGGLVYEINSSNGEIAPIPALGSFTHKGIHLDENGNVYLTDYNENGNIYRFVPDQVGDLSSGQLYVLRITKDLGDFTGSAEWIPIDQNNTRLQAKQAGAAVYQLPSDLVIKDNALYVSIEGENRVLSISLSETPVVRNFVRAGDNAKKKEFQNPSYLTFDSEGTLFIAENNGKADIWAASADQRKKDGLAKKVKRFATLSDAKAVPSGLYFDPIERFAPSEGQNLFINVKNTYDGNDKTFVIRKKPNSKLNPEPDRWIEAGTPDRGVEDPIISAHRGAPWLAPENTLDSYRYAYAYGADMVEVDVRETKDGRYVAFHDSTVDAITDGTGPLSEKTFEEVRALNVADNDQWRGSEYDPAQTASLEEILELAEQVGGGIEFDIKSITDPAKLANLVAQYDGVLERSIFNSSDIRIKHAQPMAKLIYNRNQYETPGMLYLQGAYYSVFGSRQDEYTPESIVAIHDAGGIILPHSYDFGADKEGATFVEGRAMGTDGAQTNQPDSILDVLDTPIPSSITVNTDGNTVTANLVNSLNSMGIPDKLLTVDNGVETIQLTTKRGGSITLPDGWEGARIVFAGDATVQSSSSDVSKTE